MPLLRLVSVEARREWPILRGKHRRLEFQDRDQFGVVKSKNALHTNFLASSNLKLVPLSIAPFYDVPNIDAGPLLAKYSFLISLEQGRGATRHVPQVCRFFA